MPLIFAFIMVHSCYYCLLLGPFSEYPFTDVRRTIRDRRVICFQIRQESDCVSINELNACQIENYGLTIAFRYPFQFRQILGLDATTQNERHKIPSL